MSSQGRSASSGVRNLRAMFENKDDSTTSPPQHRGRSPAPSIGNNSASPRPLSKVRTSFVAVERNGQTGIQWGLRKETTTVPPDDSTMSHRRGSFAENEATDPDVIIERKKSIQAEFKARKNSIDVSETIPEFALEMPSAAASKQGTPTIEPKDPILPAAHTPTGNPDKPSTVEERNAKLLPADVKSAAAVSGGKALKGASGVGEDLKGITTGKLKTASSAKASDKASTSKSSKPAPISTSKTSTLSKSSKSPALPKTPISSTSTKSSSRTTTTAAPKASKPSTTTTTKPAAAPTTRTNPATKKPSLPSSTGFIKPRPKSPTKPAKLPSSLTAPTSSSLSKLTDDARRTSAGATRSPSRVSGSQKSEQLSGSRKAPSSSRPSLGPPPSAAAGLKKQASRQSLPKTVPLPADEGFLARMMRPTTASAGKTHDKAATPPKVRVAGGERPGTRNGMNARGENNGSPVAARPPVPMVGAVPTLKALSGKATAGGGGKKAEVGGKKEVPVTAEAVKAVEPVVAPVVEKTEEPAVEAVSVPEPATPAEEQGSEAAVVEEAVVEEEVAAPATTTEETAPAETEVEIDEPAPAVNIEEVEEVAPVEETAVEEVPEETIEEATEEAASEVPTEDEPVVTDKVDVEAVLEGTEEPAVTDKVDVAAVVEETEKEDEVEETEVEVEEVPVVVETEADETPAVIEAETEADETEDVAEPATTTTVEEETADVPTTAVTTEKKTPAKGDKTEKVEVEEVELADASSDVTTPIPSATPVVAL